MRLWILSANEIERLEIIQLVLTKRLSVTRAAERVGVGRQRMSQLVNAYRRDGAVALASGKRSKPANNKYPDELRARCCNLVRQYYADFGPTLAAEYLEERHDIVVSRETLRKWMVDDGIWTTRAARRKAVQQRRQRRDCRGELVQLDGSQHDWFEGRGPKCTLLVYIDDATSELLHLEFVQSESTFALMAATRNYVEQHGRPLALYTDKAGVFRNHARTARPRAGARPTQKTDSELGTQFTRALDELGITLLCANTPQAKGRVERANGVLQDRLIKAMRMEGISDMGTANAYAATYIKAHNSRFARQAVNPKDLHRPLEARHNVACSMSVKTTRKVSMSLDLRYEGHLVILNKAPHADGFDPQSLIHVRVDIHDYPDGRFEILHKGRSLSYRVFNKAQRINQSDVVESKRLGSTLELIKQMQDGGNAKTYTQRRRRTAQANSPIGDLHGQGARTSLRS